MTHFQNSNLLYAFYDFFTIQHFLQTLANSLVISFGETSIFPHIVDKIIESMGGEFDHDEP